MTTGQSPWDQELAAGWEPPRIDTSVPHPNRVYNYLIGGKDHFQADRDAAEALIRARPNATVTARAVESFTRRAAAGIAAAGVRQFLQLGAAITIGNSNDRAARDAAPGVRPFIYVADDPISLAHARALLVGRGGPAVSVVRGDFRDPAAVLANPLVARRLDLTRPVGLLLYCMLDYIADDRRARDALDLLYASVCSGSMIALYHVTDSESPAVRTAMEKALVQEVELAPRSPEGVRGLLRGLPFADPGLVPVCEWRPSPEDNGPGPETAARTAALGGVILKP